MSFVVALLGISCIRHWYMDSHFSSILNLRTQMKNSNPERRSLICYGAAEERKTNSLSKLSVRQD